MKDINGTMSLADEDFALLVKRYGHSHITPMHNHDWFEIAYVEQGFSMHSVEGTSSLLIPGDILIVAPWTYHEYWKSINNYVYNCMFYPDILESDLLNLAKLPLLELFFNKPRVNSGNKLSRCVSFHVNLTLRQEVLDILKKMEKETEKKPEGWKIKAKALLVEFLVLLSRSYTGKIEPSQAKKTGYAYPIFEVLQTLESSINEKNQHRTDSPARGIYK